MYFFVGIIVVLVCLSADHKERKFRGGGICWCFALTKRCSNRRVIGILRLHSQILASSELTPIVGLAFQSKVLHYYRALGLEKNCLSFDNFTEKGLAEHILSGWHNRQQTKEVLNRKVPELQARALIAPQVIAAMHRGQRIDRFFRASSDAEYALAGEQ